MFQQRGFVPASPCEDLLISSSFLTGDKESFGFWRLIGQKKQLEDESFSRLVDI